MHDITDITVEVFNMCAGSCTGCMLSTDERKRSALLISQRDFELAMDKVLEHSRDIGLTYRPVLSFGDVIALPVKQQIPLYEACVSRGMPFGVTMTLAEEGLEVQCNYSDSLDLLRQMEGVVFDITFDPLRASWNSDYTSRVIHAVESTPEVHLQVLLSKTLMERFTPEDLADACESLFSGQPVALVFTPAIERLERDRYCYSTQDAAKYASAFYSATETGRDHWGRELARFSAHGPYEEFMRQAFHIDADLTVYPAAYTAYGDVIFSKRNGGTALGNLREQSIKDCVTSRPAQQLAIQNVGWLQKGGFGCAECSHLASCEFHGVGAARRIYSIHESKIGSCYGPAGLAVGEFACLAP